MLLTLIDPKIVQKEFYEVITLYYSKYPHLLETIEFLNKNYIMNNSRYEINLWNYY